MRPLLLFFLSIIIVAGCTTHTDQPIIKNPYKILLYPIPDSASYTEVALAAVVNKDAGFTLTYFGNADTASFSYTVNHIMISQDTSSEALIIGYAGNRPTYLYRRNMLTGSNDSVVVTIDSVSSTGFQINFYKYDWVNQKATLFFRSNLTDNGEILTSQVVYIDSLPMKALNSGHCIISSLQNHTNRLTVNSNESDILCNLAQIRGDSILNRFGKVAGTAGILAILFGHAIGSAGLIALGGPFVAAAIALLIGGNFVWSAVQADLQKACDNASKGNTPDLGDGGGYINSPGILPNPGILPDPLNFPAPGSGVLKQIPVTFQLEGDNITPNPANGSVSLSIIGGPTSSWSFPSSQPDTYNTNLTLASGHYKYTITISTDRGIYLNIYFGGVIVGGINEGQGSGTYTIGPLDYTVF
jgi:hypothetical protein